MGNARSASLSRALLRLAAPYRRTFAAHRLAAASGLDRAGARLCYNINVLMGQPS